MKNNNYGSYGEKQVPAEIDSPVLDKDKAEKEGAKFKRNLINFRI